VPCATGKDPGVWTSVGHGSCAGEGEEEKACGKSEKKHEDWNQKLQAKYALSNLAPTRLSGSLSGRSHCLPPGLLRLGHTLCTLRTLFALSW
jgi:hypothetical protein